MQIYVILCIKIKMKENKKTVETYAPPFFSVDFLTGMYYNLFRHI